MDIFSAPHFRDDDAARKFLEGILWPHGPACPHCGVIGKAYETKRPGLYRCSEKVCRKDFTVTMRTVMERSHIALHKWLQGFHLMAASKKGVSAHQLHRMLGVTYKSAWFMEHRIREAMRAGGLAPMGGAGETVEIDETFIGRKEGAEVRRGVAHKNIVLSLVQRGGSVRSFHVDTTRREDIIPIVKANIDRETHVMSDESNTYSDLGKDFAKHGSVDHGRKEYAYTDRATGDKIHINSAEGFYSVFKRGMKGVYQHCGERHLHRYVAEFDFRHSNRVALGIGDVARASRAVAGAAGKRLTYQGTR